MNYHIRLILLLVLTCLITLSFSQDLKVDTTHTPTDLVDQVLLGNGIRVGNVKYTGAKHSICSFKMDTNAIGMKSGLLLSTGNVFALAHENLSPGTSGMAWTGKGRYRPDKDLQKISKTRICDHASIEFDFVPFHNWVNFKFSFASEEYTEYVGTQFNDAFAFILSQKGGKNRKNLALIPGTNEPVTINNVNHRKNKDLFISNDYFVNYGVFKSKNNAPRVGWFRYWWNRLFNKKNQAKGFYIVAGQKKKLNQAILKNFEFDGFTKVMKAQAEVIPGKLYHLKIIVADGGDAIFDSGVFIEQGSFSSEDSAAKPYAAIDPNMNWDSIFNVHKKEMLAQAVQQQVEEKFEVTNVLFGVNDARIPDSCKNALDALAGYMAAHPACRLSLTGYTDNKGSARHNQQLSETRARAVMDYLLAKGIDRERLFYAGHSDADPVGDNTQESGRALNRRVEIVLGTD